MIELNNYHLPQLLNVTIDKSSLDSYDIGNIDLAILLFQAGYLTIQEVYEYKKEKSFKLGFPNK
ncbi:MAG TPA: hypothetical protein PLI27_10605 [Ignavibacteriales bacterium]|nr:hypothetical protein [Ignavibacteriales bacterium]HOL81723.1 hypothetical protein [Ignavibacteriales bacterium]HOM66287.1 hypothetical protein [Ignavibacteriales bacterium]HPD68510.1 hypothetical protein [Ignavibacteriales bacterium]HPP34441.1 hypothetical protein [Ignavibacteriales bacterium]